VWARSAGLGHGATFLVSLPQTISDPIAKPSAEASLDAAHTHLAALDCAPALLDGVKVLVVDDESDGRELVGRILEGCSAEVALAGSAREALDVLSTFAPDVLVSDIGMPDVDGYELIRQVRALGPGRKGAVPAAALTALARPEDRTWALLSGYQTHIAKPVDAVELIAAVAALAGRTGLPQGQS
jgi:CheY-like chemotaxis protein